MTSFVIPCPKCGHLLRLPDRGLLGRKGRCPDCRLKFLMEEELVIDETEARRLEQDAAAELAETRSAGETAEPAPAIVETVLDLPASAGDESEPANDTLDFDEATVAAMAATVDDDIPKQFGRYRIVEQIGQGSMGVVYLAHDTELDRKVALKIPRFFDSQQSEEIERFYREARAAATLRNPNICQVFDIGEIEHWHFIAMEYINGNPLSAFIKQPQPVRRIASTLRKLAKALQEAHDNGLVHRDLKPDNIMIDERGEPIIMDFGLVRLINNDDRLTVTGAIVGSPAYMSPEQVGGLPGDVGPASDIFSLGIVTYELLTGQRPFRGSLSTIFEQIAEVDPLPPSQLRPDIDLEFETICLTMMAKQVSDRFESMSQLADAISGYLRDSSPSSVSVVSSVPSSPSKTPQTAGTSPDEEAARWVLQMGGALKVSTNDSPSIAVPNLDGLPALPYRVVDVALLKNDAVDDDGLACLSGLDKLRVLRLSETNVTDEGLACLSGLTSLPVLDLSYTKVSDAGLKHLKRLKGLRQLDLANTKITDSGLEHIKRLSRLEFLGLYATSIGDAGLKILSRLKNLQFLGLYGTKVTDAGVAKLKKSLRDCTISR